MKKEDRVKTSWYAPFMFFSCSEKETKHMSHNKGAKQTYNEGMDG